MHFTLATALAVLASVATAAAHNGYEDDFDAHALRARHAAAGKSSGWKSLQQTLQYGGSDSGDSVARKLAGSTGRSNRKGLFSRDAATADELRRRAAYDSLDDEFEAHAL